ncbi:MAG: BMP family ABC transporter substrate-binding protein [Neomegalonema sp.]|nr:BMP family ABC transporter substrate-binding protein [Neomegalonema sp.]
MKFTRRSLMTTAAGAATLPMLGGLAKAADPLKVGFVYLTSPGDHGWTYAHEQGRLEVVKAFGDKVKTTTVENVAEGPDSERVIRRLATDGMDMIFTTSFGYMNPTAKVAKRFPKVKFEHATGYKRSANLSTYNARFYEGRAVCGAIAGAMSKSGTAGYIASFPIPEVVMGINAFQLAAQKVNPDFKTKVIWVSTWYDPSKEADAAKALIDQGADIITQHTDSPAALQIAEQRDLLAFGQSWDMRKFAPKAHLTAIEDHWGVYYVNRVKAALEGTWKSEDTWWGFKEGMVKLTPLNDRIPADVKEKAAKMEADIISGALNPFTGPIKDQKGELKIAEGATADDKTLATMNWYVEGVQS